MYNDYNDYSDRVNIDRVILNNQPFQVEVELDNKRYLKNFDIQSYEDMFRNAIIYRFRAYFASRKKTKTLTQKIHFDVPITYYMHPSSRFQAFKLAMFPNWLIEKFPIKNEKEYVEEAKELECKVDFDMTVVYPDIEIPEHQSFVELNVLRNRVSVI